MMKKITGQIILAMIIFLVISGIAVAEYQLKSVEVMDPITCRVEREKKVQAIVEPCSLVQVNSRIGGIIEEVRVRVGQRVKKGEILAVFDQRELKNRLRQAELSLELARANLLKLQKTPGQEEIELARSSYNKALASFESAQKNFEIAKSIYKDRSSHEQQLLLAETNLKLAENELRNAEEQLKQAENNLKKAQNDYQKMKKLFEEGVIPRTQYESAQKQYENEEIVYKNAVFSRERARINYNSAQRNLQVIEDLIDNKISEMQNLNSARLQLKIAEENLKIAEINLNKVLKGPDEEQLQEGKARVEQARSELEQLKYQLEASVVTSPVSGKIAGIEIEPGEMVGTGSPLLTIIDDRKLCVTARISSDDARFLKQGDELEVRVLDYPQTSFSGRIIEISPVASQQGTYPIKIEINNNMNLIKPGMAAYVILNKQEAKVNVYFEDGSKETLKWNILEENEKEFLIQGEKRLEYVDLEMPDSFKDINLNNNQQSLDLWSPAIKIEETNVKADYSYLVDKQNNIWFIFCDKKDKKDKKEMPQIYLNVLSPEGKYLIKRKRLSIPGEYSVEPDIVSDNRGNIILTWSGYHNFQDVVYYCLASLEKGKLNISHSSILKVTEGNVTCPSLFFLGEDVYLLTRKEEKGQIGYDKKIYFSVYRFVEDHFEEAFSVFISTGKSNVASMANLTSSFFQQLYRDSNGYFYLLWGCNTRWSTYIYLNKIDPEGNVLIHNKELKRILMTGSLDLYTFNCVLIDDKFHFLWVGDNNIIQKYFELNHEIRDLDGKVIKEEYRLTRPSPLLVNGINVMVDENKNLNIAWSDEREGEPFPNQDIIFTKLNPEGELMIPQYRFTTSRSDEKAPRLYISSEGIKYCLWYEYGKSGNYEYYLKNSDPKLKSLLEGKIKWRKRLEKIGTVFTAIFISTACLIIFFVPFNILPIFAMMCYLQFVTNNYTRTNILVWLGMVLGLLPLKLLNEYVIVNNFTNLIKIPIEQVYLINLITIFVTMTVLFSGKYFLSRVKGKRYGFKVDIQVLFIVIWLLVDTVAFTAINLIYYLI